MPHKEPKCGPSFQPMSSRQLRALDPNSGPVQASTEFDERIPLKLLRIILLLAWLHLVFSVVVLAIGATCGIRKGWQTDYDCPFGSGICAGTVFLAAAILGIICAQRFPPNRTLISSYLGISMLCVLVTVWLIFSAFLSAHEGLNREETSDHQSSTVIALQTCLGATAVFQFISLLVSLILLSLFFKRTGLLGCVSRSHTLSIQELSAIREQRY